MNENVGSLAQSRTTYRRNLLSACIAGLLFTSMSSKAVAEDRRGISSPTAPGTQEATDEESGLSVFLQAAVNSDYVFRGFTLYDQTSFQPNAGVYYDLGGGLRIGGSVWMHVPLASGETGSATIEDLRDTDTLSLDLTEFDSPSVKFVELDPTVSLDYTVGIATVSVGHTWYTDPKSGKQELVFTDVDENGNNFINPDGTVGVLVAERRVSRGDTAEVYVGLALDMITNPELTFVYDYRAYNYEYYTLGFSQPFDVNDEGTLTVTPSVKFAFSSGNSTPDDPDKRNSGIYLDNGLVHVNLGLSASAQVGDFRLSPSITYVFTDDQAIDSDDIIWSGFTVDYTF